jgi:hypothetical protein
MASRTCPNCQAVTADTGTFCPSCGSNMAGAAPEAAATSTPTPPQTSAGAPRPQIKFDLAAISQVNRLVGGGTLVLFISLFLPWYSADGQTVDALDPHGYLYVTLVLSIVILGLIGAEVLGLWKLPTTSPLSRDQILLVATVINLVLILLAFIFKPSGQGVVNVGWSFGAFVGLAAAIVAAFPLGWPIIQARRGK